MTDAEAISGLIARYCHRIDDGQWDEFGDLWAEDAEFVLGGETTQGRRAIRDAIEAAQPPERRGRHLVVNVELEIDGDRATGLSDFMFWVRSTEGAPHAMFLGRYHDVMVRTADGWCFARREIVFF